MPEKAHGTTSLEPLFGGNPEFATTNWSVVLTAFAGDSQAQVAMERLCRAYWHPLYAFIRRQGHGIHDAQDLTQAFFTRVLEKNDFTGAAGARVRFRTYLLGAVRNFLANERDRKTALKRGGERPSVTLDLDVAEAQYGKDSARGETPEKIFERRWALTVLDNVLRMLAGEYSACGKAALFEKLKPALTGSDTQYAAIAAELNMSAGAVKTAVHRMRRRYREVLIAEITRTVSTPEEADDELRHLMTALE